MSWVELSWVWLCCVGMGWVVLCCVGLGVVGLGWARYGWVMLYCLALPCIMLHCIQFCSYNGLEPPRFPRSCLPAFWILVGTNLEPDGGLEDPFRRVAVEKGEPLKQRGWAVPKTERKHRLLLLLLCRLTVLWWDYCITWMKRYRTIFQSLARLLKGLKNPFQETDK